MIPRELITGQSLIVFGLAVVAFVFLMRRTFLRQRGSTARDKSSGIKTETELAQVSAAAAVEKLEVRLFDFAREVEGRIQTRITVLDRLIVDADREILRLQDLLASTKGLGGPESNSHGPADVQFPGSSAAGKMPGRQPDAIVPQPPTDASQREAA